VSTSNLKDLTQKRCRPCEKGAPPLSSDLVQTYLKALSGWVLSQDGKRISREYLMKDFLSAIRFMNRIAEAAEAEDHHPDLHLTGYRKLRVELTTHALGGLSENDFILAAKIEALPKELKP
jgi:4a-hydroxytetrahydrobiopterin dehydratase